MEMPGQCRFVRRGKPREVSLVFYRGGGGGGGRKEISERKGGGAVNT